MGEDSWMTETEFATCRRIFQALHEATREGPNVEGRLDWTIFDNSERERGYSRRSVFRNVEGEPLQRIPGQAAYWRRDVIAKNGRAI